MSTTTGGRCTGIDHARSAAATSSAIGGVRGAPSGEPPPPGPPPPAAGKARCRSSRTTMDGAHRPACSRSACGNRGGRRGEHLPAPERRRRSLRRSAAIQTQSGLIQDANLTHSGRTQDAISVPAGVRAEPPVWRRARRGWSPAARHERRAARALTKLELESTNPSAPSTNPTTPTNPTKPTHTDAAAPLRARSSPHRALR